jgi:putative ABC transport system permease protein
MADRSYGPREIEFAKSVDMLWLVLRYGLFIGLTGVMLGIAGAMLVRHLLERLPYGASGSDWVTLAGIAALLLLVIITASAVPARRATRIEPVAAPAVSGSEA